MFYGAKIQNKQNVFINIIIYLCNVSIYVNKS